MSLYRQETETGLVPSVQDFDKKLAEADAYLQILIDQLKVGHFSFHSEYLISEFRFENVELDISAT